jgi:hypothetical protein
MIDPSSKEKLYRDVRAKTFKSIRFPGYSEVVMLSGWYPIEDGEDIWPILLGDDWDVFNAAVQRMKGGSTSSNTRQPQPN